MTDDTLRDHVRDLLAPDYDIGDELGHGGMAVVYKAKHKVVEHPFAVKLMNPLLARDPIVR